MKSKYTHSTHCVYNIGYHLIWCTKYRKKLIYGKVEHSLKRLVRYKCNSLGIAVGAMEVMSNLLFRENGEHPRCGANPIFAKASNIYPKIRSNATSNFKNKDDLLRSHLRAKAPQYSRLIS